MNPTNNKTTIAVAVLALIALTVAGYVFGSKYLESKNAALLESQKAKETEIFKNDSIELSKFSSNSTDANKQAYVNQLNQTIATAEISEIAKDNLLIRKASILSVLRNGQNQNKEVAEATDIFNGLINKYRSSTDASEVSIRDYAIAAQAQLHTQCCFEKSLVVEGYPEYAKYPEYLQKYGKYIATHLVINDLLKAASPYAVDKDISIAQERLAVIRMVLFVKMYSESQIDDEIANQLADEAGAILKDFNSRLPLTYKDYYSTQQKPIWQVTSMRDLHTLYTTKKNPSPEQNKDINESYDIAFAKLTNDLGGDKVAVGQMYMYLFHFYISSLHTRYPLPSAIELADRNIDMYVNEANSYPELANYLRGLYKQGLNSDGTFNKSVFGSYLKMESDFPKLQELHKKLGITYTK